MIELKNFSTTDLTTRTVRVYPAVPPVIQATSTQQQYVDEVVLTYQKRDAEPWKLYRISQVGARLLKCGVRGNEIKSTSAYVSISGVPRDQPDWLVEIANFFTPEA